MGGEGGRDRERGVVLAKQREGGGQSSGGRERVGV